MLTSTAHYSPCFQPGLLSRTSSYTATAASSPQLPTASSPFDNDTAIAGEVYVISSLQLKRARKQQHQVRQQVQPSQPVLLQQQPVPMLHQLQASQHHSVSTPLLNIDGTLNIVPSMTNRYVAPAPSQRTLSLPASTAANNISSCLIAGGIVGEQMLEHGFLYVKTLMEGGAAHRAGVLSGDIILQVSVFWP